MINELLSSCKISKININPNNKISGSVSIRQYCEGGTINRFYGCRYHGQAAEKIQEVQPGAIIKVLDGEFEDITTQKGETWTCLIIRDFEISERTAARRSYVSV